ncbi:MAG: MFS transporter, partial [Candidatus Heimdallarchaeaceae archaeon]
IVLSPFIGWFISSKPRMIYPMLLVASILTTLNLLLFYFFYDLVSIYAVFLFVKNIGQAFFFPVVFTIFTFKLPKEHFSLLYSITTTLFFLGYSATSFLAGVLYNQAYNLPWFYAFLVGLVLTLSIVLFMIFHKEKE